MFCKRHTHSHTQARTHPHTHTHTLTHSHTLRTHVHSFTQTHEHALRKALKLRKRAQDFVSKTLQCVVVCYNIIRNSTLWCKSIKLSWGSPTVQSHLISLYDYVCIRIQEQDIAVVVVCYNIIRNSTLSQSWICVRACECACVRACARAFVCVRACLRLFSLDADML